MKTEYQKTPIGEIPKEWKVVRLGDYSELIVPMRDKPKLFDGDVPWIRIEDLDGKYLWGSKSGRKVSSEVIEKMNLKIYPRETVLCSCSGEMGVCAITKSSLVSNQTFIGIVPKDGLNSEYLYYLLTYLKPKLQALGTGTTIPYLSRSKFEKLEIPLPSIQEQHRIAEVFSSADLAIEKTDEAIAKTERLKKGLMQKLLKEGLGHERFRYSKKLRSKIPELWQIKPARDLFYIKGRIGWRGLKKSHYTEKGPYLITGWDFEQGKINWEKCFHIPMDKYLESPEIIVQKDDIVLTKDGTIGKVAYIYHVPGSKASLSSHLLLVRNLENNDVHTKYSYYLFQSHHFSDYVTRRQVGSTRAGLTQKAFEEFPFPLPPLEEQKKIASILSIVDRKLELERERKKTVERIKQGLMNDLLSGRRRVKVAM